MTREEVIGKVLDTVLWTRNASDDNKNILTNALVKALEQEPCEDCPLVEIVTCKDCKHRDPEDKFCDCGHAIKWSSPREDNFFCADAERRE